MNNNLFSLHGRVAMITGARQGIGREIALQIAQAGADLVICDRTIDDGKLADVAGAVTQMGRRCLARQVDVTVKAEIEGLIKEAVSEMGTIDILVNNAAIASDPRMLKTSEEEWQKVLDVNLKGVLLCSQLISEVMIEKKSGCIISVASATGIKAFASRNTYNISKAGVMMLTKILARDLGRYNIRVNAVAPTAVNTEMSQALTENPELMASETRRIPLRRIAETVDIAAPVVFLASDAASYITGHILVIDGGMLA